MLSKVRIHDATGVVVHGTGSDTRRKRKRGTGADYVVFGTETGDLHEHQDSKSCCRSALCWPCCLRRWQLARWRTRSSRSATSHRLPAVLLTWVKTTKTALVLAVEEINAKGLTIGGQKVTLQLDAQDDAADPRTATQVAPEAG